MKNNFKYLLVLFGALFLFTSSVLARPAIASVSEVKDGDVSKDLYLVKAKQTGDTISAYVVTTDLSKTNGESYSTQNTQQYITLPNGLYYVWIKSSTGEYSDPVTVYVTESCTAGGTISNATDTGSYKRCARIYSNGTEIMMGNASDATCAPGYNIDRAYSTLIANDCGKKKVSGYGISYRYCSKEIAYKCLKASTSSGGGSSSGDASTGNSKLSSLTLSSGTLTPSFSPSVYQYTATTNASSIDIGASLMNSNASFVNGYGPRTVNLNYGVNTIEIKTQDGNTTNTYTIKVKRNDSRSGKNTLSSLSVSSGQISPVFNEYTNNYFVTVGSDTKSVDIVATLSDSSSSYVENYGPRTIEINDVFTRVAIKVRSQAGSVRTYSILFTREGGETVIDDVPELKKALLKKLELSAGNIEFDPNVFDYNVAVTSNITNIEVIAEAEDENDEVVVNGGENLEINSDNEISIIVTSSDGKYANVYTIYVNRKPDEIKVSNDSLLSDLSIKDYKIKFDAKTKEYKLNVKSGTKSLDISAVPADDRATITIEGNDNLKNGSVITIRVTAEDNSYTDYKINVKMIEKGGNTFLTIIVVILIILAIAYLVLRAMGYKIYFNLGAVKEKVTGIFKKN